MLEKHPLIAPWMSIWNGDPDGHMWPQYESFILLCSPVSFYHRLVGAQGKSKDITYKIYDELHAASPWLLFLLSFDLAQIARNNDSPLKIILMTATTNTPIFKTALKAVRKTIPYHEDNHYTVEHPDPEQNPFTRTHTFEDAELPDNFKEVLMPRQASFCIERMINWAHERNMSASILVLVPGEKEMEQIMADWVTYSRSRNLRFLKIYRLDSNTPAHERKQIRLQ